MEGDRLIVDAEIYESATAISSRDNPVGQRFAFAPLASLGITKDDGELHFEERRDEAMDRPIEEVMTLSRLERSRIPVVLWLDAAIEGGQRPDVESWLRRLAGRWPNLVVWLSPRRITPVNHLTSHHSGFHA